MRHWLSGSFTLKNDITVFHWNIRNHWPNNVASCAKQFQSSETMVYESPKSHKVWRVPNKHLSFITNTLKVLKKMAVTRCYTSHSVQTFLLDVKQKASGGILFSAMSTPSMWVVHIINTTQCSGRSMFHSLHAQ
jgi:hypothetical protein